MTEYFPIRFRTEEDAMLFLRCCQSDDPFPPEKRIPPCELVGNEVRQTDEYRNAPFELQILSSGDYAILNPKWQELHLADCFPIENPS